LHHRRRTQGRDADQRQGRDRRLQQPVGQQHQPRHRPGLRDAGGRHRRTGRQHPAGPVEAAVSADELDELIAALVGIDSVNPALDPEHPGEAELGRFVADWCEARDLKVEWLEATPGRPSVIATAPGSGGGRNLLLNAHLDTVGVKGMDSPFTPRVRDGRLYGRGAMDMKASLAACMLAVANAATAGPAGDVILTAVADEEHDSIGTRETIAHLARTTRVD